MAGPLNELWRQGTAQPPIPDVYEFNQQWVIPARVVLASQSCSRHSAIIFLYDPSRSFAKRLLSYSISASNCGQRACVCVLNSKSAGSWFAKSPQRSCAAAWSLTRSLLSSHLCAQRYHRRIEDGKLPLDKLESSLGPVPARRSEPVREARAIMLISPESAVKTASAHESTRRNVKSEGMSTRIITDA